MHAASYVIGRVGVRGHDQSHSGRMERLAEDLATVFEHFVVVVVVVVVTVAFWSVHAI